MWGGFAQANWTPSGSRWGVDFGARYDHDAHLRLRLRAARDPLLLSGPRLDAARCSPAGPSGRRRRSSARSAAGSATSRTSRPASPARRLGPTGSRESTSRTRTSRYRSTWHRRTSTTTSSASRRRARSTSRSTPTPTFRAPARRLRRSWHAGRRSRALTFDASYGILDFRNTGDEHGDDPLQPVLEPASWRKRRSRSIRSRTSRRTLARSASTGRSHRSSAS